MAKIVPFIWLENQAEEAAKLYCSIFENARIVDTMKKGNDVLTITFEVAGQRVMALNGGPHFKLNEAFSFFVSCETQAEVDRYWDALTADGGAPSRCGWLKDKFGLSWQIVPVALGRLLSDPDKGRAGRAMEAMMKMSKLDVATLEKAAAG